MYKIIGVDGKEYGPVTLEQLKTWIAGGRVNGQTRVQQEGSADWRTAAEFPEIANLLQTPPPPPPPGPGVRPAATPRAIAPLPPGSKQSDGLAITSFVLGLVSVILCLGPLAGIPAVICGHIARRNLRSSGVEKSGSSLALPGLILGYVGIVAVLLVLPAMLLPALAKAKSKVSVIQCSNNMRQIGLAFQMWANDNNEKFPFEVSESNGGTSEFRAPGPDGVDRNPEKHIAVLAKYLAGANSRILVCPADSGKQPAPNFNTLEPGNVSYQLRTGPQVTITNSMEVLLECPVHHNVVHCDGSVEMKGRSARRPRRL